MILNRVSGVLRKPKNDLETLSETCEQTQACSGFGVAGSKLIDGERYTKEHAANDRTLVAANVNLVVSEDRLIQDLQRQSMIFTGLAATATGFVLQQPNFVQCEYLLVCVFAFGGLVNALLFLAIVERMVCIRKHKEAALEAAQRLSSWLGESPELDNRVLRPSAKKLALRSLPAMFACVWLAFAYFGVIAINIAPGMFSAIFSQ